MLLRRVIAPGLLGQHGGAEREDGRALLRIRIAARDLELRIVPRRLGVRVGFAPGFGLGDQFSRRCEFVHNAVRLGLFGRHAVALQQERRSRLRAHDARQALRAATARHQADLGFRQAELQFRIVVRSDAVVATQRHFETATERETIDSARHRLLAGFQRAEQLVHPERTLERRLELGFRIALVAAARTAAEFAEVCAGAEAALLARGDDEALDIGVRRDFLGDGAQVCDRLRRKRVHRTARNVKRGGRDAVCIHIPAECFEFHVSCLWKFYLTAACRRPS